MLVTVRLLQNFNKPLTYRVEQACSPDDLIGKIVRVPLRNIHALGIIQAVNPTLESSSFAIKNIIGFEPFPHDNYYFEFIQKVAHYYQVDPIQLMTRFKAFLEKKAENSSEYGVRDYTHVEANLEFLTDQQQLITEFVKQAISKQQFTPTLLHGVTGSGKTEVYKHLMVHTLQTNKSTLLLLPEVSLAIQFAHLLKNQLHSALPIVSFHSAISPKEKKNVWQKAIDGHPMIVVGVHQPVLLPLSNLGLIIVDEEHDAGYQEKKHPKINSKDCALLRAQHYKIPILLGSATPSVNSLYNVENRHWHFFSMPERYKGVFPRVSIVSLKEKKEGRKHFWISKELEQALKECLCNQQQAIIFINRRGYSFFIQCSSCSYIVNCSNCSVSLTLHEENILSCHYCGFSLPKPIACPSCKASEKNLLKKGLGTQQVVSIIQKLFPHARIARADADTTLNRKKWYQSMQDFQEGKIDILVGTQTITKGYHFSKVALIGIIWADLNIHFPMYNAAEIALQQLIQVAGRAGRTGLASMIIVQTMAEHPIFSYVNEVDYKKFYHHELENRRLVNYPPVSRLVEIELKHHQEAIVDEEARIIAQNFIRYSTLNKMPITVLGPAKPPVHKIKNEYSRKIYLKSSSMHHLTLLFSSITLDSFASRIFFTPNPLQ